MQKNSPTGWFLTADLLGLAASLMLDVNKAVSD
jgi:hypothetical protein